MPAKLPHSITQTLGFLLICHTSVCACVFRFVVSCIPSWFWGPMVTLEDCLAAFFAADELKGETQKTLVLFYDFNLHFTLEAYRL